MAAPAAEISTHVLDLARGLARRDIPVVLFEKAGDGRWVEAGRARTDENGRVWSFGATNFDPGTYKLQFDMTRYSSPAATPLFPEIDLVFSVAGCRRCNGGPIFQTLVAQRQRLGGAAQR